ncbi:helix-turn-helix transcriptional regulator [Streptomyces variabilis]
MSASLIAPTEPDTLLTTRQVSTLTKLEPQTLANLRWRKAGPPYVKLGKGRGAPVRYSRQAVLAWLEGHTVRPRTHPSA